MTKANDEFVHLAEMMLPRIQWAVFFGAALAEGRKRRRRRAVAVGLWTAAVAVIVAVPAVLWGAGKPGPAAVADARTAYVTGDDMVVPVNLATGAVGAPIKLPTGTVGGRTPAAATPDGQTVYEAGLTGGYSRGYYNSYAVVTPIDTATNRAGRRITLPSVPCPPRSLAKLSHCATIPLSIAIEPNGKTAYVGAYGGVYVINIARHTAGKLIRIPASAADMAFTPDGKTLYVVDDVEGLIGYQTPAVTPIGTATNTARPPIKLPDAEHLRMLLGLTITPNGRTAYVVNSWGSWRYANSVIPIDLATNKALAPIRIKASGEVGGLVITPDGGTAYLLSSRSVTPIDTATNKAGPAINLPESDGYAYSIALTPNGKTIYVLSPRGVIPISTASRTVLPMITVPDLPSFTDSFISPDGRTLYVDAGLSVVPISTATNKAGHLINIGSATWTITFAR